MPLFTLGKKKEVQAPQAPTFPQKPSTPNNPVDIVLSLRQQGMDNNQIVQYLQRSGYGVNQIFDALNQADLKGPEPQFSPDTMQPFPEDTMQPFGQPPGSVPQSMPPPGMTPPMMTPPMSSQGMPQPPMPPHDMPDNHEQIEELVETVIDEKWEEFSKNINKIIEWKNATEARVISLDQQFKDLKDDFSKLHAAIIGKIGEYDQNIQNVGTDIKAMEKVFQKILPTFSDNVNELSRITKNLKSNQKA